MAEIGDHIHSIIDNNSKNVNIEVAAREPWPANVYLYVPLKEQMVLWAPDCLATLCLLRKVRVPSLTIEHVRNAAEMSNYGIPPVLTLNNRAFSEFDEINNLIELKGLLVTNNDRQNSSVDSYTILCTETLGALMKYFLLCEKAGTTVYQSFTSVYPWPLGLILYFIYRKQMIKTLQVKEIWSLTYEQALIKFETTVKALSNKIQQDNSNYLLGDNFTKADAHLYGHLYPILHTKVVEYENLRNILNKLKPLVDYVNNLEKDILVFDMIPSIRTRDLNTIFRCSARRNADDLHYSPYSLSSLSPASIRLLRSPRKQLRKIPKTPLKVLDAPELQDDIYLNLVNWSSTNILAVGLNASVYLWNANTNNITRLCDLQTESDTVTSVAWSDRGQYVAVGTHKSIVQIWDATTNRKTASFPRHTARVDALAWNDQCIYSSSLDRFILQNDTRSNKQERKLAGHRQEVCRLKWSLDRHLLASERIQKEHRVQRTGVVPSYAFDIGQQRAAAPPFTDVTEQEILIIDGVKYKINTQRIPLLLAH
ncbi:hypothetical protein I4U23_009157 [Adineta vaga]|nr:hypothetical protein I4U23_009157 [Adineta vaga]